MINNILRGIFYTIGKIIAYIIIGVLIALILGKTTLLQVKAEEIPENSENSFFSVTLGGTNLPVTYSVGAESSSTKALYIYNYEGLSRPYKYLILDVCTSNAATLVEWTNSVTYDDGYFVDNSIKLYKTGSCVVSGFKGVTYKIQLEVGQYACTDSECYDTYAYTNLKLVNNKTWTNYFRFDTATLSSENVLSSLVQQEENQQTQEDIKENTENIENSITSSSTDVDSDDCGIICKLGAVVKGVTNLPSLIWNAIKGGFEAITGAITSMFDFLTNDEVDDSQASGFFDSFSTEDNGGISSVVTAPLTFVQRMTDTCQPLTIPFYDNDISLPCGDTLFWNRAEVQDFRNVWNILLGGTIIYFLLTKVFKIIQNIKDPDDSKVEVMKL